MYEAGGSFVSGYICLGPRDPGPAQLAICKNKTLKYRVIGYDFKDKTLMLAVNPTLPPTVPGDASQPAARNVLINAVAAGRLSIRGASQPAKKRPILRTGAATRQAVIWKQRPTGRQS